MDVVLEQGLGILVVFELLRSLDIYATSMASVLATYNKLDTMHSRAITLIINRIKLRL